jgi:hypothetical protein
VSDELAEDRSGFADLTTSAVPGLWNDDLRKQLRNTSLRYFELVLIHLSGPASNGGSTHYCIASRSDPKR